MNAVLNTIRHATEAATSQAKSFASSTVSSSLNNPRAATWSLWTKKMIVQYPAMSLTVALSVVGFVLPTAVYPFVDHGARAQQSFDANQYAQDYFAQQARINKQKAKKDKQDEEQANLSFEERVHAKDHSGDRKAIVQYAARQYR
jgi:hypothetical protein